jgi:predicted RNase H-like HicB family nuclease
MVIVPALPGLVTEGDNLEEAKKWQKRLFIVILKG